MRILGMLPLEGWQRCRRSWKYPWTTKRHAMLCFLRTITSATRLQLKHTFGPYILRTDTHAPAAWSTYSCLQRTSTQRSAPFLAPSLGCVGPMSDSWGRGRPETPPRLPYRVTPDPAPLSRTVALPVKTALLDRLTKEHVAHIRRKLTHAIGQLAGISSGTVEVLESPELAFAGFSCFGISRENYIPSRRLSRGFLAGCVALLFCCSVVFAFLKPRDVDDCCLGLFPEERRRSLVFFLC